MNIPKWMMLLQEVTPTSAMLVPENTYWQTSKLVCLPIDSLFTRLYYY